jgi:hypothetical protein
MNGSPQGCGRAIGLEGEGLQQIADDARDSNRGHFERRGFAAERCAVRGYILICDMIRGKHGRAARRAISTRLRRAMNAAPVTSERWRGHGFLIAGLGGVWDPGLAAVPSRLQGRQAEGSFALPSQEAHDAFWLDGSRRRECLANRRSKFNCYRSPCLPALPASARRTIGA